MTNEESILCIKMMFSFWENMHGADLEAMRKAKDAAIYALRSTATGDPLTPEQLMEMDGRPIWIEHDADPKYNHVWMIWNNAIGMRHNLAGYNIFWRAYAYPSAHIAREAWVRVQDRLPDKDGWYLVFAPGYWGNNRIYGLDGLAVSKFKHNYKVPWGIEGTSGRGYPGMITHWIPIPEPPDKEANHD